MKNETAETEKRIVEQLNFGAKTAKRVGWEAWEFAIVGPRQIEVTNASYGFEKDDHTYNVTVNEQGSRFIPVECECPADQYNEEYDCKHKIAVASIGGPVLLGAAMAFTNEREGHQEAGKTAAELLTDGGQTTNQPESDSSGSCPNGAAGCVGPESDGIQCWECYRTGA